MRKFGRILTVTRFDRNEVIYGDIFAIIVLRDTKHIVRDFAVIDCEDVGRVSRHKWHLSDNGYAKTRVNKKTTYLHRFIMESPDDLYVDHVNHDQLDNRKINLRVCTPLQSSFNRGLRSCNTSNAIGVSRCSHRPDLWRARITVNHEEMNLGVYKNKDDAVWARERAERRYFGEFRYQGRH